MLWVRGRVSDKSHGRHPLGTPYSGADLLLNCGFCGKSTKFGTFECFYILNNIRYRAKPNFSPECPKIEKSAFLHVNCHGDFSTFFIYCLIYMKLTEFM